MGRALLRGLLLGAYTKCTPSAEVEPVPRFTPLDHHGRQDYQRKSISACFDGKSLCNNTQPIEINKSLRRQ